MPRDRKNPWRRFRVSQLEQAIAWARVGNVAVLMLPHDAPRDHQGRIPISVWVQTPARLKEVRHFLKVPNHAREEHEPLPHLCHVHGMPRKRALDACGHVPDARPHSRSRHRAL